MRKKQADYLQIADDKKVRAIYTIIENGISTMAEAFVTKANGIDDDTYKELKRRTRYFLDGSAKMYMLEEAKKNSERWSKKQKVNSGVPIQVTQPGR